MKDLLTYIIQSMADHPEEISIEEVTEGDITRLNVSVADSDYPRVIGKSGLTIKAITDILRTAQAHISDIPQRIYVNIVSTK